MLASSLFNRAALVEPSGPLTPGPDILPVTLQAYNKLSNTDLRECVSSRALTCGLSVQCTVTLQVHELF